MATPIHNQIWSLPPNNVRLSANEVHVWRASLQQPATTIHTLEQMLAGEERARAARYLFEKDRSRFIVARGVLRILLGRYLETEPGQVQFSSHPYGKSALAFPTREPPLKFNVSHSHDFALYAFAYAREVGIDIEYMRAGIDYEQLARVCFSPFERAVLQSLPLDMKQQAFFNCWTRKEAYIKARGMGLSLALDLFDVSMKPGEPAVLLNSREDPRETTRWEFRELPASPGYVSALAVEGHEWHLRCWQWQEAYL